VQYTFSRKPRRRKDVKLISVAQDRGKYWALVNTKVISVFYQIRDILTNWVTMTGSAGNSRGPMTAGRHQAPRTAWRATESLLIFGAGVAHQYNVWLRTKLPGDRGSMTGRGKRIFPLTSVSRPAIGPTQPPVQWVPEVLCPGVKRCWGVKLTTHPM
jgi:hypothetical protein